MYGLLAALIFSIPAPAIAQTVRPYQKLWIPPLIEGKSFNLTLDKTTKSFWAGATTDTYSFNKTGFWGPTLVFNRGDTVQINVKNNLPEFIGMACIYRRRWMAGRIKPSRRAELGHPLLSWTIMPPPTGITRIRMKPRRNRRPWARAG